jgi:hypothetical protein
MRTAPNIDGLTETLGRLGVAIPPEVALELLGWVGLLISGGVAGFFLLMKVKAEKRTYSLNDLLARIDKQDESIRHLRCDMENLRRENSKLWDENRDHAETLKDFAGHVELIDLWIKEGGNPPVPAKSWRIRQFLAAYMAEHEHRA